jgi:RND family efflux transporter MFP subunit
MRTKIILVAIVLGLAAVLMLTACTRTKTEQSQYHCPMHPTYIADKPGDCPICGMKLVPIETKTTPPEAVAYACPMHPEVVSDKPGKCSKCGMDLEPVKPGTAALYQCPMRCEPPTHKPGKCGKCGMDLEPLPTSEAPAAAASGERKILFYRNPMNPSVTSPVPMKDEMGMDFVPVYSDEGGSSGPGVEGHATVEIGTQGIELAGIQTAPAVRESLARPIRAVGTVLPNETAIRHVHTKISGWIEKLYANFTGQFVTKGAPILSIYSPELLASQQEFLNAKAAYEKFSASTLPEVRTGAEQLMEGARRRLELFDVPPEFIRELETSGKPRRTVTLLAPSSGFVTGKEVFEGQQVEPGMELFVITDLSSVWIETDIYEYEASYVKLGQKAVLTLPYDPSLRLEGRVSYVYPSLNPDTRTLRVRLEFSNPGMRLKPSMFANVELDVEAREGIVIPDSALMDSGTRKLVFVETAPGKFAPKEVTVGVRGDGKAQILSGVAEGERVVVKANFLLDSESRLRSAIEAQTAKPGTVPGEGGEGEGTVPVSPQH